MNDNDARALVAEADLNSYRVMAIRGGLDQSIELYDVHWNEAVENVEELESTIGHAMSEDETPLDYPRMIAESAGRMVGYAEQLRRQADELLSVAGDLRRIATVRR